MKPLNAREWLEAERLAGNPWAADLIDLIDGEDEANENANVLDDLRKRAPKEIARKPGRIVEYGELWRLVEWITDRLALLEEVEALVAERCEGVTFENGSKPVDVAETLTAAFDSERWQDYDL